MQENEIKIGTKSTLDYVLTILKLRKKTNKITILARGKSITKAIDVSEIVKGKEKPSQTQINSTTENFENNNKQYHISAIEIKLAY